MDSSRVLFSFLVRFFSKNFKFAHVHPSETGCIQISDISNLFQILHFFCRQKRNKTQVPPVTRINNQNNKNEKTKTKKK